MARKLPVNTRIPIEINRQLESLTGWAQQDEARLNALEGGGAGASTGVGASTGASTGTSGAFGAQQQNLLQSLSASAAQMLGQAPSHYNSPGAVKQIATDTQGNFYWCYAPNRWARIGSGGYSNSF